MHTLFINGAGVEEKQRTAAEVVRELAQLWKGQARPVVHQLGNGLRRHARFSGHVFNRHAALIRAPADAVSVDRRDTFHWGCSGYRLRLVGICRPGGHLMVTERLPRTVSL